MVILLGVNRRRFICTWFKHLGGSSAIFFFRLLLLHIRIVSIEGDRMLEESSAQHASVYLHSKRIHVGDIYGGII